MTCVACGELPPLRALQPRHPSLWAPTQRLRSARCLACHACGQGRQLGLPGCACRQGRQLGCPAVLPGRGGARVARLRSWLAPVQTRAGALPPADPPRAPIIALLACAGRAAGAARRGQPPHADRHHAQPGDHGLPAHARAGRAAHGGAEPTGRACGGTLGFTFRMHPAGLTGGTLAHHASHALSQMAM